jgi:heme A synthase
MSLVKHRGRRAGEAGGARLNFVIIAAVIALAGYSAYNYAPVAYNAFLFKDVMQETVSKAAFPPGQTTEWVTQQLRAQAKEYDVPADMTVNVQMEAGQIVARVQWIRPVRLPGYTYQYKFDHTVRSSGFINQQ